MLYEPDVPMIIEAPLATGLKRISSRHDGAIFRLDHRVGASFPNPERNWAERMMGESKLRKP